MSRSVNFDDPALEQEFDALEQQIQELRANTYRVKKSHRMVDSAAAAQCQFQVQDLNGNDVAGYFTILIWYTDTKYSGVGGEPDATPNVAAGNYVHTSMLTTGKYLFYIMVTNGSGLASLHCHDAGLITSWMHATVLGPAVAGKEMRFNQ